MPDRFQTADERMGRKGVFVMLGVSFAILILGMVFESAVLTVKSRLFTPAHN